MFGRYLKSSSVVGAFNYLCGKSDVCFVYKLFKFLKYIYILVSGIDAELEFKFLLTNLNIKCVVVGRKNA